MKKKTQKMKKQPINEHYIWLSNELKDLKRRTKLFNLLKNELSRLGHWKNKARGDGGKQF